MSHNVKNKYMKLTSIIIFDYISIHSLDTTCIIAANRCTKDKESVFRSHAHTNHCTTAKNQRTKIERATSFSWWNIIDILAHHLVNCFHKEFLRYFRHECCRSTTSHTGCISLGSEYANTSIFSLESLETFKALNHCCQYLVSIKA